MAGSIVRVTLIFGLLLATGEVVAQECEAPAAEWLFCDDFEDGLDPAWLEVDNVNTTSSPANVFSGVGALEITSHQGVDNGGGAKLDLAPGEDEMYLRFYVKLSANFGYLHHFVQLAGRGPGRPLWFPFGSAGCLPSGSNFFTSGLEIDGGFFGGSTPSLAIPGRWTFYTYYMDMTGWGTGTSTCIDICADCTATRDSGNCNDTCYHGNAFAPSPDRIPALDRWYCMEMSITANTGANADGGQAMWMDGVKIGEWSNIRWRTDPDLKVNSLLLQHYTTADYLYAPGQTQQTAWFDNIVLSTAPIGCLGAPPADSASPGGDPGPDGDPDAGSDPLSGNDPLPGSDPGPSDPNGSDAGTLAPSDAAPAAGDRPLVGGCACDAGRDRALALLALLGLARCRVGRRLTGQ